MIVEIELDTIQYETNVIIVGGMTCASCSSAIKSELLHNDGVNDVTINLITGKCIVKYDIHKITIRRILRIIEDIGFSAQLVEDETAEEKVIDRLLKEKQKLKIPLYLLVFTGIIGFIGMLLMMLEVSFYMREVYPGISLCTLITMVLGIPIQIVVGAKHYKIVWRQLKGNGMFNMDTLIILSTSLSLCLSVWMLIMNIYNSKEIYVTFFDTSIFIFMFVYIGKYLEIKGKLWAAHLMSNIVQKDNHQVRLIKDMNDINNYIEMDNKLISVDDVLLIKPGENIPCDGIIILGETHLNESMLTGESIPVYKKVDDIVYGGTVNISETICVKARHTGKNTCMNKMRQMVEDAQLSKTSFQNTTDKICKWFVYIVLSIAVVTFITWIIIGRNIDLPNNFNNITYAIYIAISVIVVSCPCALGLATPIAIMVGTGVALREGILLKSGGEIVEKMSRVNTIIFDKTGTLTYGNLEMIDMYCNTFLEDVYILSCISNHPLSTCIRNYCKEYEKVKYVKDEKAYIGKGVECRIDGIKHYLGSKNWLDESLFEYANEIKLKINEYEMRGISIVLHAIDNKIVNVFGMSDSVRKDAFEVIKLLKSMSIDVWLMSGDNKKTVLKVAEDVGIKSDNVIAEVSPENKAKYMENIYEISRNEKSYFSYFKKNGYLKLSKRIIAMVGDGGNDSIALAKADIGIAMRNGSDLALSSASVILMKSSLMDVYYLKKLSNKIMRTIYINLIWATSYNLIAIPLAAGVFYPMHLNPMCAGLAMSLSSVIVVLNSILLRYF